MNYYLFCLISLAVSLDWTSVQQIIQAYRQNGTYPGASIRVANSTHILYSNESGFLSHDVGFGGIPVLPDTVYDIASLTKVTGTLACIMNLVDSGIISINDLAVEFIPELNNKGKNLITIKNLLLHNAGFLPDVPYENRHTKQQAMNYIYNCSLQSPIGTKFVYSDIGFIILGEIASRVIGGPLEDYVKLILESFDIYNTSYLPSIDLLCKTAPTEFSSDRKKVIRGEVHDPTSYLFGGVAGHAGLFSVADDLVKYMQLHLNKGITKSGKRVYSEKTVQLFYTRVDGLPYENRRALGWDTVPIQDHPPCGRLFSLNSFGHTGFTGTMMWADRDKDLIVVFLTNRVHPSAENREILPARTDVCDEIVRVLQNSK